MIYFLKLSLFRKSKLKSENANEEGEPEYKIKKEVEIPSSSSKSLCLEFPSSQKSIEPSSSPKEENFHQTPPCSLKKEDIWCTLQDGGEIKDLLPSGIIKNSSKLRFDVKEISLAEEV